MMTVTLANPFITKYCKAGAKQLSAKQPASHTCANANVSRPRAVHSRNMKPSFCTCLMPSLPPNACPQTPISSHSCGLPARLSRFIIGNVAWPEFMCTLTSMPARGLRLCPRWAIAPFTSKAEEPQLSSATPPRRLAWMDSRSSWNKPTPELPVSFS